jgi:prepilin signal peptidase PulO-like enzyme (type II secretory pathway)
MVFYKGAVDLTLVLILLLLGMSLGSFINALVWRVHRQEDLKNKDHKKIDLDKLSIIKGRSMCPNCRHTLSFKDLIPVLSWLGLKGKCRYCHKPISIQYPLVELITALIFIISYLFWPVSINGLEIAIFGLWLILLTGLIALAIYDLKWLILPNRIIYPLVYVALLIALLNIIYKPNHLSTLVNEVIAMLIGGGIFYILFQISKGKWIGGGDVRLGLILGLSIGTPGGSILTLFLASVMGSLVSLPLMVGHKLKKNSVIPFGPFLIIAALIVQLAGHFILSWYQNTFFPYGV